MKCIQWMCLVTLSLTGLAVSAELPDRLPDTFGSIDRVANNVIVVADQALLMGEGLEVVSASGLTLGRDRLRPGQQVEVYFYPAHSETSAPVVRRIKLISGR